MRFLDRSSGNNAILVKGTWDGDKMAGKYSIFERVDVMRRCIRSRRYT